ncbi:MAG: DNA repair protein RecN [Deltaproteobacteria bacterium]|jgi:DNA repair protein RecN (Recombination protein N)|nr:DNA repair protein RecN [Deltaproteobacteria bacterium]
MLTELKVKNLALIERLTLSFGPGVNLLTGETGAGKSILVGALGLLKGQKASADFVRAGAEEAEVEALFVVENPEPLAALFAAQGLEPADEIIIRRQVTAGGRSRTRLNGNLITLAQLANWGEELLAITSQHDQQSLTNPARQMEYLDNFGQYPDLLAEAQRLWRVREEAQAAMETLEAELRDSRDKKELFEFQLAEIKKVNPQPDEDFRLMDKKNLHRSGAKLAACLGQAREVLEKGKDGLFSQLERVRSSLVKAAELDPAWSTSADAVSDMAAELTDLAGVISAASRGKTVQDSELEALDERLSELAKLKRKHGPTLEEVLAKSRRLAEALGRLAEADLELSSCRKKMSQAEAAALANASQLTQKRKQAAQELAANLETTLRVLGFPKIQLTIEVNPEAPLGPRGVDQVIFLFAPNPGEGTRPLAKIASGGELSRLTLALKIAQTPRSDQSLVFDEIDAGLSGGTAEAVAAKIAELATRRQVFVITHLPQMACLAGRHFLVAKSEDSQRDRTVTTIQELPPNDRAQELARMLGGACPSPEALALSHHLLGL